MYIKRNLEQKLHQYRDAFPVVCVTGPRQSGKSTMLQQCLSDYRYVTFDDHRMVDLLLDDPTRFFHDYADKVILDEVQKVPDIFGHLKLVVDRDRDKLGNFILTGSSQFSLMQGVADSLAGRIGLLSLLPFQLSEVPEHLHDESLYKGSYPEPVTRDYRLWRDWYASYVETYLQRDVRSMANIGDLRDFRRLLKLIAARVSQPLNMASMAGEVGVSVPTVKRWISILEASYVLFLLPPYYENFGKRVTKSPKVYFYDSGLVAHLTGIDNQRSYSNGPLAGPLFENYVISEVLKAAQHRKSGDELYYLRTSHGAEIDLIVDRRGSREFIEIKSAMTFKPAMLQHLKAYGDDATQKTLVYSGEDLPGSSVSIRNYRSWLLDGIIERSPH